MRQNADVVGVLTHGAQFSPNSSNFPSPDISGYVGQSVATLTSARTSNNCWSLSDIESQEAADCIDLDLGFTPATNLIAMRRLSLEVGARSQANAAWLDFPGFTLKQLEQQYHRLSHKCYEYVASNVGYADF